MKENFYADLFNVKLTPTQRRVLTQMYEAGSPMSIEEVGGLIGGESANWPPTARVFLSKLRRVLDGTGWGISTNKGGSRNPGAYCVEFVGSE